HPHVVQDTTHVKGVPVIYSMGNAVSNMSVENTRLELAVTLRFIYDRNSDSKSMLEPQLDFMWCTLPGRLTDSYATIFIKEWATRRSEWLTPSDFDNMTASLERVKQITGIR
ncbi:MAG: CapA family protein, partial [Bacteroidales bacterium]|nr:CapA family protein [Bacteroidales bacterium]